MERRRKEIMPGVMLTCLKTDKFKTGRLSVNLLTRLKKDRAAKNALTVSVLRRGTARHPDIADISMLTDELYGASVTPAVRKTGEIQVVGFFADFINDAFTPDSGITERVIELTGELLLFPNTRGGLLLPEYVDSEKEKLSEKIRGRINDKRGYSVMRLYELMCASEDYSVDKSGTLEELSAVNYIKLTKHYRALAAASPVEVFYCGCAESAEIESAVKNAFETLPRGEIDQNIGTYVRMSAGAEDVRVFSEEMDVNQGKLAVGFRLGSCMKRPDRAVIRVFNALYGGSVNSKLFMNVREKLSLCYFASSGTDLHKGLLTVSSGIDFDKYDAALSEIAKQLDDIKKGEISDEELHAAKKSVASDMRLISDSPAALESFYLDQNIIGSDCGPEELAALVEEVTRDSVVNTAAGVLCDTVYFLKGDKLGS